MAREEIHAALFALLEDCAEFVTVSRKLRHWADVDANEQPALFLAQGNDADEVLARGTPGRLTIQFDVYLYVNTSADPEIPPSQLLNGLIDVVKSAIAPTPGTDVQTLGGLCHRCSVAGATQTDEGTLGEQAVAIIPIEIVVP